MELLAELANAGIDTAGFDFFRVGEFQRLPLINGKKSKKDASVKIQGYDPLVVTWTNFKAGIDGKFVAEKSTQRTYTPPKPKPRIYQHGKAESLWSWGKPCEDHPYLTAKRVNSYGLREHEGALLVPLYDECGNLHNVQRIRPDGTKRYLKDCRKQGCFFQIGVNTPKIVLCEGYATGATIYAALGWCVVVCFDCFNLEPVASALRRLYPQERFIFAADNDRHTKGNPGITKAVAAAQKHGGAVYYPKFGDNESGSDWNDLEALHVMQVAVFVIKGNQ
jgi:hypothetical protein